VRFGRKAYVKQEFRDPRLVQQAANQRLSTQIWRFGVRPRASMGYNCFGILQSPEPDYCLQSVLWDAVSLRRRLAEAQSRRGAVSKRRSVHTYRKADGKHEDERFYTWARWRLGRSMLSRSTGSGTSRGRGNGIFDSFPGELDSGGTGLNRFASNYSNYEWNHQCCAGQYRRLAHNERRLTDN
jgi:hypothetical protein